MGKKNILAALFLFVLSLAFGRASDYVRPSKIVMLWDYYDESTVRLETGTFPDGLDVISPTWFYLSGGEGDVSNFSDSEYVSRAHENGLKVWALFENRSDNLMTLWALFSESKRKKIIDQIAGFAREYALDGINVDFESMSPAAGKLFEKFIVELYAVLNPMGIVLSVDIPVSSDDTPEGYDLALIGNNSDYIVVMAYDQHHGDSDQIGPVAAINWVKQGIEDVLEYVPCEKVILGIPFFTRIWIENTGGGGFTVTSELEGMKEAYERFDKAAMIWGRDRSTEQIYAEYSQGPERFKTWLEDEHSISLKLDAVNDFELAGLSAWRSGWEWDETWDLINAYFE